jgi:hypothetical protein
VVRIPERVLRPGRRAGKEKYPLLSPLSLFSLFSEALDKWKSKAKIPEIPANLPCVHSDEGRASGFMTSKPFSHPQSASQPCKHPRVQIVSREEDAEFVECLECREVFESSELKDMSIEESTEGENQES